jgi:organic hydroperoxide reductase OsmC/OhrA
MRISGTNTPVAGKLLHTAHAHVVAGRTGHGETDARALDVDLRRPTDMGGLLRGPGQNIDKEHCPT